MNKMSMLLLLIAAVLITACTTGEILPKDNNTQIANPASKYCIDNGGVLEIRTAVDGSQTGFCTLNDGTVCEEWAYMRGECPNVNNPVACTAEAKICPDGTAVGRTGPNCEFQKCPEGKLKAYDCPTERTQACTKEYMPVCGQVQVQCIKAPCPPVMQTFGNKCDACANKLTISYTEGACQDNLAGGTVPAGTKEEQCTSIGGMWSGYDCEGISAEQCQEIGGAYNECASACRNNPTAQMCTLQCVVVCQFTT